MMWFSFGLFLLVGHHFATVVRAETTCTEVSSWQDLKREVTGVSEDKLVFCPFRISKPANDRIQVTGPLSLACSIPKRCIMRGEGTHFHVRSAQAELTLSGFVVRGATRGALRIFQSSRKAHVIRDCLFRDNNSFDNRVRGGAIRLDAGTKMSIFSTRFLNNRAVRGGAIYHRGSNLAVERSVFVQNKARIGGALAVEQGSKLTALETRFLRNTATVSPGGAINAGDKIDVAVDEGVSGEGNSECDGVFANNRCYLFSDRETLETFQLGNLSSEKYGIRLSTGLSIRLIAESGKYFGLTSPDAAASWSGLPFHMEPDGAHAFELHDGGWVYTSNSEGDHETGGVYTLEFDSNGRPRNYTQILSNTTRNCNGGATPWNTWISCEEHPTGQCWQVDPTGVATSAETSLGEENGGFFEAAAFAFVKDKNNQSRPVFFVTEDTKQGALRRFRPDPRKNLGWDMLHGEGQVDYLEFLPNKRFRWTESLSDGRRSADKYYRNCEGIVYHDGELQFVSKVQKELFRLNLETGTYEVESTRIPVIDGGGSFGSQPDHLVASDTVAENLLFFSEDGGRTPGIYVHDGESFTTLLEARGDRYVGDETTGLAFSPDGMFFYFCLQENGLLFQVTRSDNRPFQNHRLLKWKYDLGRR